MVYDYLSNSNCSWHSTKCDSINYSLGSVSDLNSFASVNSFNALHSPDKGFQPASSSTPIKRQSPKTTPSPTPALKVFHINFQSLREKSSSLVLWNWINQTLLLALKLGLPKRCLTASFSHQSLDSVYRRNHIGQKGGGVIILVRSALSSEDKSEFNSACEKLWVQLNLVDSKSVLIGAYYKPHEFDQHSLDELSKSLDMVKQTSSTIWLMGDLNLPKADWQSLAPTPDCNVPHFTESVWKSSMPASLSKQLPRPHGVNTF